MSEVEHYMAQVTLLKAELEDALNVIEDLLTQSCGVGNDELDHQFMSAYEDAIDFLVASRPDRWEATNAGARRIDA